MQTSIEKITPEMATQILENHNSKNRNVSEGTVQSYANDMKNGRWTMTHQGLAFDINGTLLDGQHRLWAIVFANTPIEFMVTRGLPVEKDGQFTMDAIDRNRVRTTGQQMQLCHSVKNGNVVAAAMRVVGMMCNSRVQKERLSTATSLIIYEIYKDDIEQILQIASSSQYRKSSILGPLVMYHKGEPEKARELTRQLMTLENMAPAARALKKYLDVTLAAKSELPIICTISNAVHAFDTGKPQQRLQDHDTGLKFLTGMFPSTTKKIYEATTPCRVMPLKRPKRTRRTKAI